MEAIRLRCLTDFRSSSFWQKTLYGMPLKPFFCPIRHHGNRTSLWTCNAGGRYLQVQLGNEISISLFIGEMKCCGRKLSVRVLDYFHLKEEFGPIFFLPNRADSSNVRCSSGVALTQWGICNPCGLFYLLLHVFLPLSFSETFFLNINILRQFKVLLSVSYKRDNYCK